METLFLEKIQQKLGEVPGLKYIDEDWGQLDDYSPNFPVQWPCCLIDLTAATFSNIGIDKAVKPKNRQEGTAMIAFTFANLKLTNSSFRAPKPQKDNAWSLYKLTQKAHEALHGFSPEGSGKLIRTAFRRIKRDDGLQQYQIIYSLVLHNV